QIGSVSTQDSFVCKTFASGVIKTFNKTMFHVNSTCPVMLTHFSHAGVDCYISVQRDLSGFMKKVEITVNKIATIIQDGMLTVEGKSVSLPYDHTYQRLYRFGIYKKLESKVLPLSVTWYSKESKGVTSLSVDLNLPSMDVMSGMCGGLRSSDDKVKLLTNNIIRDENCHISDETKEYSNAICKKFQSKAMECLEDRKDDFEKNCHLNTYSVPEEVKCSFYEEFLHDCDDSTPSRSTLLSEIPCEDPECPTGWIFHENGPAYPPTCSNPGYHSNEKTRTCLPPDGFVLNDRAEGHQSVKVEDCPCRHGRETYNPGHRLSLKCQT
ncbi:mucin-19-like, partial [Clarias magur]